MLTSSWIIYNDHSVTPFCFASLIGIVTMVEKLLPHPKRADIERQDHVSEVAEQNASHALPTEKLVPVPSVGASPALARNESIRQPPSMFYLDGPGVSFCVGDNSRYWSDVHLHRRDGLYHVSHRHISSHEFGRGDLD